MRASSYHGWPIIFARSERMYFFLSALFWRTGSEELIETVKQPRCVCRETACCCQMPARSELRLDLSSAECRGPSLTAPKVDCQDFMIAQAKQVHAFNHHSLHRIVSE